MAEAIFNKLASNDFLAISAGTKPASEVNPLVIQALSEIEMDASGSKPKPITQDMVAKAERIITMGCEASDFCPAKFLPKVEAWNIEDPKGKSLDGIRSIRDTIREHVEALLREMRSS
jgi:arsenate reductase